jgi:sodium/hydrogen exchanger 8
MYVANPVLFLSFFNLNETFHFRYALSLHLDYSSDETRHVVITTTLIIVMFTTLCFGGSTLPLLKFLQAGKNRRTLRHGSNGSASRSRRNSLTRRREKVVSLSKTKEYGHAIDSEHLSELTEEEDVTFRQELGGFAKLDRKFFTPFFTRRFTNQVNMKFMKYQECYYLYF